MGGADRSGSQVRLELLRRWTFPTSVREEAVKKRMRKGTLLVQGTLRHGHHVEDTKHIILNISSSIKKGVALAKHAIYSGS